MIIGKKNQANFMSSAAESKSFTDRLQPFPSVPGEDQGVFYRKRPRNLSWRFNHLAVTFQFLILGLDPLVLKLC